MCEKRIFILWLAVVFGGTVHAQITIDTSLTIEELVRDILIKSDGCDQSSNYQMFTGTSFGFNGIGAFEANGTDFPYENGVVLSTGRAVEARGGFNDLVSSGPESWGGDEELRNISGIDSLYNASYISFDFVPIGDEISFNFLFASEEYAEFYQCEFSDVFAFILTLPNGGKENLAVVPETNEPVSVTTIRPGITGIPDVDCRPKNPSLFSGYNEVDDAISFEGSTVSLKAETTVTPGANYNIKLVIADFGDPLFDSAVFLEAGSFDFFDLDFGENRLVTNGNPLCIGEELELDATTARAIGYTWYQDGVELQEFNNEPRIFINSDDGAGNYSVEVRLTQTCSATESIEVEFIQEPLIIADPVNLTLCVSEENPNAIFDFSENTALILGNQDSEIYQVTYFKTEEDATEFAIPINNINNYEPESEVETIYARISSQRSCYQIASFQVITISSGFGSDLLNDNYFLCIDENGNAIEPFLVIDSNLSPLEYSFRWYSDDPEVNNFISNETSPSINVSYPGTYSLEVFFNDGNCSSLLTTEVIPVVQPENISITNLSDLFAPNQSIEIFIEGDSEYLTSLDGSPFQDKRIYDDIVPGEHIIEIMDIHGCHTSSFPFVIVDYPRFFTPNNDGVNDTWQIFGYEEFDFLQTSIFNRYGKLLKIIAQNEKWDGQIDGQSSIVPGEYWFSLSYKINNTEGKFKSHFSLKM